MLEGLLAEAAEFRAEAQRFLAGELDEDTFRSYRVRLGIYGQRQTGVQMVRIKIPGGLCNAAQLRAIAEAAEEFGHGAGHITTRQDVQLHFVPLPRVADAMERLAHAGLYTREAGGNAVRNVTACALAGRCPGQAFDVRPFAEAIARRYLRSKLALRLPRKFKFAFSCSLEDCALGDINDIGASAMTSGGRLGFRLRVGGGLGPSPQAAETLYEFIPVEELGPVCDAVLRVFDAHGNRCDRHLARLKFVIRRQGIDWFREKVEEARAAFPSEPWEAPEAPPLPPGESVWVAAPRGNLTAEQFRQLALLAEQHGDGTVCFSLDQNVLLNGIGRAELPLLIGQLAGAGFSSEGAGELADVVACPGAATCIQGITRSMDLGNELAAMLASERDLLARQITIRVGGCPNSCGHHYIGQIGLYGNARKLDGETAPFYQLLIGGGKQGDAIRFGQPVAAVPARLAPQAVRRVITFYKAERLARETFLEFVDRRGIEAFQRDLAELIGGTAENMLIDWGDQQKFVVQVGRGECSA